MFCKLWSYVKYYIVKLNLGYDSLKEPWRFWLAVILVGPCFWGLTAENFTYRYISVIYLVTLLITRMYGHSIVKKLIDAMKRDEEGEG